jgi:hypothetical protein
LVGPCRAIRGPERDDDDVTLDDAVADRIFALGPEIRYVALGSGQDVRLRERSGLVGASSTESDRYEELLVNPTLLTLAGQRGDIDCGGLRYLIVAYGNFWQLVLPTGPRSHLSVGVERDADPVAVAGRVLAIIGAQPGQSTGAANGLS